jgi:hypothetical protein
MHAFVEAMGQDDMEQLEYLRAKVQDALLLERLDEFSLEEAEDVHRRVNHRFSAQFTTVWKQHEKRLISSLDLEAELIERVLRLRGERLVRERQELYFLQRESMLNGDDLDQLNLDAQIKLTVQAKQVIDMALPEAQDFRPIKRNQRRRFGR